MSTTRWRKVDSRGASLLGARDVGESSAGRPRGRRALALARVTGVSTRRRRGVRGFAARRALGGFGHPARVRVGPRVSLVRAILRRVAQGGRRRRERLRRVGVRLFGDAVRSRRASFSPPPPVHLGRVSKPGVPPRGPRVRRLLAGHPPRDRLRRRRLPRAPPRRALRRRHPPPRPRPRRRPARTPRGVRATSLLPNRSRRARARRRRQTGRHPAPPPAPRARPRARPRPGARPTGRRGRPRGGDGASRRVRRANPRARRQRPRGARRVRSFAVAGETGRRVPEKVRRDHRLAPERTGDEVRDHRLEVFHFEVLVLHFEVLVLHDVGGGGGALRARAVGG